MFYNQTANEYQPLTEYKLDKVNHKITVNYTLQAYQAGDDPILIITGQRQTSLKQEHKV